jgi:tetratricopeptide (TPR) repeat protein
MLMTTLYRSGQRADALRAFRQLRLRLDAELGVEPGPELQRLHQCILSGDADPAAVQPFTPPHRSPAVVPRQLPAAPARFVGRAHELRRLDETIGLLDGSGQAPVVWLITGCGGIGKSSLAAYWAHRAAGDFPDGQLYVDLEGFSRAARPVRIDEAIRGFLQALGVAYADLPESADAQAALYRSVLAGKRVLVLLDNALDADHVRALIPGGPGCAAVVTSRSTLEGLVVSAGARVINVDVLSQAESRELITRRLGADRARAEAGAVAELARSCGGLPLALAIVAARAAARPTVPLTAVAAEIGRQSRLDALETSEEASSIREVLSWSYRQLSQPAARMFRLLGLHPGPSTSIAAAASLGGIDQLAAHRAIAELTQAHMLSEHVSGRFFCHDLLHAYAAEKAAADEDGSVREAATRRLVDHYLHSAATAARVLYPSPDPLELDPMEPGALPEPLNARRAALAWLRAEHRVLLAVIEAAAAAGLEDRAWKLAAVLTDYLDREGHWHDLAAVGRLAIAAARRSGDQHGEAHAHLALGTAYLRFGWHDTARRHLLRAIAQFCDGDARARRARCHVVLGRVLADQGLHARARIEAEHALELYRAARHRVGEATALGDLGSYLATLGDHATAVAFCRSAVYLHREVGNRAEEAHAWNHLGFAMHKIGDEAAATDCYRRALDLLQEVSDRPERAAILTRLGDTYRTTGNRELARAAWRQALTILDRLHDRGADDVRSRLQDGLLNVAAAGRFEP